MNGKKKLDELYQLYLNNQCSNEEFLQLVDLLGSEDDDIKGRVLQLFESTWAGLDVFPGQFSLPETRLPVEVETDQYQVPLNGAQVISVRSRWKRYVAVAAVILVLLVGGYFMLYQKMEQVVAPQVATQQQRFKNDIAPGREGAILTLADGSTIVLDSAANGTIAQQGNTKVTNKDGQLAYTHTGKAEVVYNTMTTPRGRKYNLVLPDGSRVWLDASSSITFPTAFVGGERRVSITGQAYFSVKHNAAQPFRVRVKGADGSDRAEVEDLGTEFNIEAYTPTVKTTLVEGKVRVSNNKRLQMLKPGQQAVVSQAKDDITVLNEVNIPEIVAWKNDLFYFRESDITAIMDQVERWYDVEIVYEDRPTDRFVSTIPRDVPVSEVFKILETTGRVHFRIEGKKVTVMK